MAAPACAGGSCQLFGFFGIFVQSLIGAWCVLTLFVLWQCETPRRSFVNWLGDMSKQLVGACWGHFMNVFIAIFFGTAIEAGSNMGNQCVWYLVGFLSDIIFVTFLCWLATSLLRPSIKRRCGIDIGDYEAQGAGGAPPSGPGRPGTRAVELSSSSSASIVSFPSASVSSSSVAALASPGRGMPPWLMWICQTGLWILLMTFVKIVVSIGVLLSEDMLYTGTALCFHWLGVCGHQNRQLVLTVIVIPVIGDALQFAVQDFFLKKRNSVVSPTTRAEPEESDRAALKDWRADDEAWLDAPSSGPARAPPPLGAAGAGPARGPRAAAAGSAAGVAQAPAGVVVR